MYTPIRIKKFRRINNILKYQRLSTLMYEPFLKNFKSRQHFVPVITRFFRIYNGQRILFTEPIRRTLFRNLALEKNLIGAKLYCNIYGNQKKRRKNRQNEKENTF